MKRLSTLLIFRSTDNYRCGKQKTAPKRRNKIVDAEWRLRLLNESGNVLYESSSAPIGTARQSPTLDALFAQDVGQNGASVDAGGDDDDNDAVGDTAAAISMHDWTLSISDANTNQIDLQSTFLPQTAAHLPVIGQFVWDIIEAQADPPTTKMHSPTTLPTLPLPCNDMTALDFIAAIRILRRLGYYGATVPLERTLTRALEENAASSLNDDETVLYLAQIAYCEGLPYVWRLLRANNAYERIAAMKTRDAAAVIEQWDKQGAPTREAASSTAGFVDQSQFFWIRDSDDSNDDFVDAAAGKSGQTRAGQWLDGTDNALKCSSSALCAKDADACLLCKQTLAKALVWNLMYGGAPPETLANLRSQSVVKKFEASYMASKDRRLVLRYDDDDAKGDEQGESINSCAANIDRRKFARNLAVTIGKGKPAAVQFVTISKDNNEDENDANSVQWPLKSLYEWFCIMLWQHSTLVIDVSGTSRTAKRFYTTVSSNAPPLKSSTDKSDWVIVPLDAGQVSLTAQHSIWFEQFANAVKTLGLRVVDSVDVPDTCLYW